MNTLKLTIDDKQKVFTYPSEWSEVTVKQYRELQELNSEYNSLRNRVAIVAIMLGIGDDLIYQFSPEDFNKIEADLIWFLEPMQIEDDVEYIELNEEKYYLYQDFKAYGVGEMISIELLIEKSKGNLLAVYNELLCIFLRKKDENGKYEKFTNSMMSRASLFDNVPIGKINSMMVFFSNIGKQ